jgi:pimeloyl-ACP methyl ester carboxylesterase
VPTLDIDGPVNYVDFGGAGEPLVLVHGLGGSLTNWIAVAPLLTPAAHVVALDLRGHGRTPASPEQTAGVDDNRKLLERFVDEMFDGPVTLMGNSMGGMISLVYAGGRQERVRGLVLVDPSVPTPPGVEGDPTVVALFGTYATPGKGERFVSNSNERLGPEAITRSTIELCCHDPSRVPPDVIRAHVEVATERHGKPWAVDSFLQAARSLLVLKLHSDLCYALIRALEVPALIVHGAHDRLVPVEAARAVASLRPDWTLEVYEDAGHMPQLEVPEQVAGSVIRWLAGMRSPAGE